MTKAMAYRSLVLGRHKEQDEAPAAGAEQFASERPRLEPRFVDLV